MKHRGVYPYPTEPGLYPDIKGWRGGLLEVSQSDGHQLKRMRRKQDALLLGFPIVFYENGLWWRSRYSSTYDRMILR